MNSNLVRNRRLGLVLLVTVAIMAVIFLVPGIALGLETTFDTSKDSYLVGETVVFDASILFNASAEEVAKIQAVTLNVQPSTSTKPGSESFSVNLPISIGNFSLTDDPAFANLKARDSTLDVAVTWTDLGPGPGGYAVGGYKGTSVNARMDFQVRWLPPILRVGTFTAPPTITNPGIAFPNPGTEQQGVASLNVALLYDLLEWPCLVAGEPCAPAGSQVLGLAFDRYNYHLLLLMDTNAAPGGSGNDTLLVLDPWTGFLFDVVDVGVADAQDVTWLSASTDAPKSPVSPGSRWVAYGPPTAKKVKKLGTTVVLDIPGTLPISGLGANLYDTGFGQWIIASDLQTDPGLGIPVWARKLNNTSAVDLNIVAGPTGGGYNDLVQNDVPSQPTMIGAFGGKVGEFDLGGAFLGAKAVSVDYSFVTGQSFEPPQPLSNITGLAVDQAGNMFLVDFASPQASVYEVYLPGVGPGGPAPGANYARAIASNPTGNIYLLMDDAGVDGFGFPVDKIVTVNDAGSTTGLPSFNGPSDSLEGLAFLNGALYTVDNYYMVLYKLDPTDGTVIDYQALPEQICGIGGLTTDGTKLIGAERYVDNFNCFERFYRIDPDTGSATFTTINPTGGIPQPLGLEAIAYVTGAPTGPYLLAAKYTSFYSISLTTGAVTDYKPVVASPPYGITGLTQRGNLVLFTDDSQLVFKAGVPGAPPPENTVAGDYKATFSVTLNPSTPPPVIATFTIARVKDLVVTITVPEDNAAFVSTPITVKGTVNDPTVQTVTLGIDLASTVLLGPATFEADLSGFGTTGLWHRTDDFNPFQFGGAPRAVDASSLAYTKDSDNGFPNTYNYDTAGAPNAGVATSPSFKVGDKTKLTFWTWYFTEPGDFFDKKVIKAVPSGGAAQAIAQIVGFPPIGPGGVPQFDAAPGTVYPNPGIPGAPPLLVFIPVALTNPSGAPQLVKVELPLDAYVGQQITVQFAFDSVDGYVNGPPEEGWFVDDIAVEGAGAGTGKTVSVAQFATTGVSFEIAEGPNTITVQATRNAYLPVLTDSDTVTVFLDTTRPIIRILRSEDLNENGVLDTGPITVMLGGVLELGTIEKEDITGDGNLTRLPSITNNAVQTVFGIYKEETPALLTIVVNGKLVLSQKDFDSDDPTFSTTINLKEGLNTIVVNLKDKGGLDPDSAAVVKDEDGNPVLDSVGNQIPVNRRLAEVTLDTVAPTLSPQATKYPFTAIAGTPGDPVVYQVSATDATGISSVTIFVTPTTSKSMIAASDTPLVLRDQWGTTGNFLFPAVIPVAAPPGTLTRTVKATDLAGNTTSNVVTATVTAAMTAWNTCLQKGGNLISLPIQPTNGSLATLLSQKVFNFDPTFKLGLLGPTDVGYATADPQNKLDAAGDVTLANVVESIQYWPGGVSGEIDPATGQPKKFLVYTPDPATDTLLSLKEGRAYWMFMRSGAFKTADALPGFTEPSVSCMTLTTLGQFLAPGGVPPVVPVVEGWNMVGRHTEEDTNIEQFLAGVSFVSITGTNGGTQIVEARVWTSLLAFLNGIFFDYQNAGGLPMGQRVTQKLGAFESRFNLTEPILRGEGFWLFVVTDGVITP